MKNVIIYISIFALFFTLGSSAFAGGKGLESLSSHQELFSDSYTDISLSSKQEISNDSVETVSDGEKSNRWLELLLVLVAIETGVVALMLPLSFDMVSRLTDKYKFSSGVSQIFMNEWEVKTFMYGWIPFTIIFLLTHYFFNWFYESLHVLPYLMILVVNAWILFFFRKLIKYLDDSDYLINKFFEMAENEIN